MPRIRTKLTPLEAWNKAQNTLKPGETEADRTRFLLGLARLGQHTTFTEKGQPGAILPHVATYPAGSPEQMALEASWEQRSLQMHENQHGVELEDKPVENHYDRQPGTLARGD